MENNKVSVENCKGSPSKKYSSVLQNPIFRNLVISQFSYPSLFRLKFACRSMNSLTDTFIPPVDNSFIEKVIFLRQTKAELDGLQEIYDETGDRVTMLKMVNVLLPVYKYTNERYQEFSKELSLAQACSTVFRGHTFQFLKFKDKLTKIDYERQETIAEEGLRMMIEEMRNDPENDGDTDDENNDDGDAHIVNDPE